VSTVATDQDRLHLRRALELAAGGHGRVSPNPMVGAVLVRDDQVIGEGFHAELGGRHAEVEAIEDSRARGVDPTGATLLVTLEPCAHQGRQPPCVDAIRDAGIARVVVASDDPSDEASGRGPEILREAGVAVELVDGDEADAARLLNQSFRKHAQTGRPLVAMKSAVTLDGRVATAGGDSQWISSEDSRLLSHRWRAEADAVCVGIGTALADDPRLTAREVGTLRQPTRVVFDGQARLPTDSRLVQSAGQAPLVVIASSQAPEPRVSALREAGADVVQCEGEPPDRVTAGLTELGLRDMTSVLLEGGPTLAGAFLDAGEIDELRLFVAPIVVGGMLARPLIAGNGALMLPDATAARAMEWERSGDDLLIRARLREW
jgi:diaminohydroxyphosphoribosylaminopyrimidine deaminase/5-amino-6-(5-phosphoribosylamino)uracil reductase